MIILSFISHLNLTADEKTVYEALLSFGHLTSFEVAEFTHIGHNKVVAILDSLFDKGAILKSEGYITKYFARVPLGYLGEISEKLATELSSAISDNAKYLEQQKVLFEEKKNKLISDLNEAIQHRKDAISNQFNERTKEIKTDLTETTSSVTNETDVFLSALKDNHKNLETQLKDSVSDILNSSVSNLNQLKENFEKTSLNIIETVGNKSSELNNKNVSESQAIQEKINSILNDSQPKLEALDKSFINELNEIFVTVKEKLDIEKVDMREFNKKHSEKSLVYSEAVTESAGKAIDDVSNSVKAKLDRLNVNLETLLNTKVEEMTLKIKETINALTSDVEAIKQDMIAEIIQQKSGAITSAVQSLKDELAVKFTDLQNGQQDYKKEFISERDMFSQKLDAYYSDIFNEYQNKLEEIKTNAQERFSAFNKELFNQYSSLSTEIFTTLDDHKKQFSAMIDDLKVAVTKDISEHSETTNQTVTSVNEQIQQLIPQNEEKISKLYEDTMNSIEETLTKFKQLVTEKTEQAVNRTIEITEALISLSKKEIDEAQNTVSGFIDSEITGSLNFLDQYKSKVDDSAKELISTATQLGEDFQSLEATTKHQAVPKVETSTIIGLDAVRHHIRLILERTRRKVILLVPRPEEVPVDTIKSLPSTAQVIIVTKIDPELKKEWLRDIYSAKANVQVRTLREGGGAGGGATSMPLFYAIERANEEILFATEDEATKEVVGILSHSMKFAQILSYTMIAHYSTGASRQIQQNEFA